MNKELIQSIAATKKPVIMSVGMSNLEEIKKSYGLLKEKCEQISLLHCISAYPTDPKDSNLSAIHTLKENFDCVIGQSDHTNDIKVPSFCSGSWGSNFRKAL